MPLSDFRDELVSTLRIARAALLYLVDMMNQREHWIGHDIGLSMPLHVPDYHETRGT